EIDFFPPGVADVVDPQVATSAIEREAPGIPKAVAPDFPSGTRLVGERIRRRHGVRLRGIDVEPQDLAYQRTEVLRALGLFVVAKRDIQIAVGSECQRSAVVVLALFGDG